MCPAVTMSPAPLLIHEYTDARTEAEGGKKLLDVLSHNRGRKFRFVYERPLPAGRVEGTINSFEVLSGRVCLSVLVTKDGGMYERSCAGRGEKITYSFLTDNNRAAESFLTQNRGRFRIEVYQV